MSKKHSVGWAIWMLEKAGFKRAARHLARKTGHKPPPLPKPVLPIPGCDYVSGPSPAALRQAGIRFVCRYLSTPGNPKNLTAIEAKGLHAAGIGIVLVFETTGTTPAEGRKAGIADAVSAKQQAAHLGAPVSVPIYFAVDFDARDVQLSKVIAYITGAASVLGSTRTGVYGSYGVVKAVHAAKACKWLWQCLAWSGGSWYSGNHIEQYAAGAKIGGANVDLDRAVKTRYGAWESGAA